MALPNHPTQLTKRLFLVAGFVLFLLFVGHEFEIYLPGIEGWIAHLGAFAPLGFIAMFVVLSPLFVSVDALCFISGILFSLAAGEIYVAIATYLAATVIFLVGRYLLRDRVRALITRNKQLTALETILRQQPFKVMFLLRLTPIPFALSSYAFSIAEVRFWPYLGATSGILLYNASVVYFGYAAKHLAGAISGSIQSGVSYPMIVLGLLISLAVIGYVAKLAGETIKRLNSERNG